MILSTDFVPTPEPRDLSEGETCNFSDAEEIDAFCSELLAALTLLEQDPTAWQARARARLN